MKITRDEKRNNAIYSVSLHSTPREPTHTVLFLICGMGLNAGI